jgi:thiol-disulfide isomerase/thioredoxin
MHKKLISNIILKVLVIILLFTINLNIRAQIVRNFEYMDLENVERSFEDLKGSNLTLIDFWATWCSPCKKAIPELNKIYSEYKDKGVEIIGINCDGPRSISKVKPYSKSLGIKYPVLIDMDSELKNELNLITFPTLIIVNSKNQIIWIHEGFTNTDSELIRGTIDKYISQN